MIGKKFLNDRPYAHSSIQRHDFLYVLRKNYWIFLLTLALFMVLVPFFTAGLPGDSIFNIEVTHDQMKFRLIHESVLPAVLGGCILMGAVCGITSFRFLQDKKETTIFLSLGMTRLQLFANRLITGMLMIFAGIAIPMIVSMALNIAVLGVYDGLVRNTFYLISGMTATAFISLAVTIVVGMVSGTVTEVILYWCGIMAAPFCICFCVNRLLKALFWGNAWGVMPYNGTEAIRPSLVNALAECNPCTFFFEELQTHSQFMRPLSSDVPPGLRPAVLLAWIGILIALLVLAMVLIKRRNAEIAGISGTSRGFSEWMIILTSFAAFTMIFTFLCSFHFIMAWALGIAGCMVVHLFWRKTVFSYDLTAKAAVCSLAAQTAVFVLLCVVFMTGGFNSVDRFLDRGEITEAGISYVGEPGGLYRPAEGSSTGKGYYMTSQLTFSNGDEIDKIVELQRQFTKGGRQEFKTDEETFANTIIPYDITFTYTDEDGKEHVWYYDRASLGQLAQMLTVEESETVQVEQEKLFAGQLDETENTIWAQRAYQNGTIYLTDEFCSQTYELGISEDQRKELLEAVWQDRKGKSTDDLYFPDSAAKAVLMFSANGEYDCEYYAYNLDNCFVYVSEDDKATMAWLEKNDLLDMIADKPKIESVTLQKFDPHMGSIDKLSSPISMYFMSYRAYTLDEFMIQKEFGNKYTITDQEKISQMMPGMRNGYFMSEGGYLAAIKLEGDVSYIYMFLPAEYVPDFVKG